MSCKKSSYNQRLLDGCKAVADFREWRDLFAYPFRYGDSLGG